MYIKKKTVRSFVTVMALGAFFGLLQVTASFGQGPLKEILDRMDNNNKTLSSFRSNVTMVKYNEQIGSRDTTEGTTSYLPKSPKTKNMRYVRIDWVKPVNESIVVMGDEYLLYRPKLGQAIKGNTAQAKNNSSAGGALALVSMSKSEAQSKYSVQYVDQEGLSDGTQTWHILMTPKIASSYKSAELWVDVNGMPRQVKITEKNDDTTTVLLTKIEKNAVIDASQFSLSVPAGTKIIKG